MLQNSHTVTRNWKRNMHYLRNWD